MLVKNNNIPLLRFPEFEAEWESKKFKEFVINCNEKYDSEKSNQLFKCIELEHLATETGQLLGYNESKKYGSIKNKFSKGDVLFGKLRPYLKKYLMAPFDGVCSSEIWVFKGKQVNNSFLYWLIQTEAFLELANQSSGSKMPRADWSVVSTGLFSLPSLPEQEKIAAFFTAVDEKVSGLKQKKELLEQYKKGLMQKIFPQELRFKDDNGHDFPDWEEKKLDTIIINFLVPMRDKPKELSGEIPWCRIEDFEGKYLSSSKSGQGVTRKTVRDMNLKIYPINTLLVSCSANLGFCAIVKQELITNQTFIGLVPNENKVNVEFLYYIMKSSAQKLNVLSSGTTISYLSREQFEKFKIALPSIPEQTKIANFLSSIDEKIDHCQKQIECSEQWKKGLLQRMFC